MTPDFARCDFIGLGRRAAEVTGYAVGGFLVWLLCLPVICFAGLALYALATGAWPREATVLYLALAVLVLGGVLVGYLQPLSLGAAAYFAVGTIHHGVWASRMRQRRMLSVREWAGLFSRPIRQ